MDSNNIFTFFYPVIESFNKGSLIKKVVSFLFRFIGVIIFVGGVYLFFKTISYVPDFWSGVLLFLLLFASILSLQIWFYRAKSISNLEDSEFTVIPIFSNLLRALGENYAIFIVAIGLGGTLNLWFSNYTSNLGELTRFIPLIGLTESSFIGGLMFLFLITVIASFILLLSYFLAENSMVLVEIARNTRELKKVSKEEQF